LKPPHRRMLLYSPAGEPPRTGCWGLAHRRIPNTAGMRSWRPTNNALSDTDVEPVLTAIDDISIGASWNQIVPADANTAKTFPGSQGFVHMSAFQSMQMHALLRLPLAKTRFGRKQAVLLALGAIVAARRHTRPSFIYHTLETPKGSR